jgi:guanylate kinase
VVIGPSGAGKSTLVREFVRRHPDFELIRTHTTRPARPAESDTHIFVTDEQFEQTEFLGTVDVFGARYGLAPFAADGRVPVVLLRVFVLDAFAEFFPDAKVVQLEAPVQVLQTRLTERGDADRADAAALAAEIEAGRARADAVVDTGGSFEESLEALAAAFAGLFR